MLGNYLAAALRHLAKSRLFAGINILGLAVGFAAPMLIALYAHHELSYDHSIPDHGDIFRIHGVFAAQGSGSGLTADTATPDLGRWLNENYPSLGTTVRMSSGGRRGVSVGSIELADSVSWADPEFFEVFQLPVIAGDLKTALHSPDTVVLTRAAAQRYFARSDPVGELLRVDRQHPLRVAAVIEDLPGNTHLSFEIVASTRNALSPYVQFDSTPYNNAKSWESHTYLLRKPGVTVTDIEAAVADYQKKVRSANNPGENLRFVVMPIVDIHLSPPGAASMNYRGSITLVKGLGVTAVLILLIASINFVNLATARASRRAIEVGVRKAAGATRGNLIVQFIGESLLYAATAALIALAMTEWLLPLFNKLAYTNVVANYQTLIATLVIVTLLVGVLAGSYPALVLSAFRPAVVLKGGRAQTRGGLLRQGLVLLQFAMLIALLCCIVVIFQQTRLAMEIAARIDTNRVVAIQGGCDIPSFVEAVRSLPDVEAVACSQSEPFGWTRAQSIGEVRPGLRISIARSAVDFGFFELYGLRPLAGRLFSRAHGSDAFVPSDTMTAPAAVMINAAAVPRLQFASPQEAIGQFLDLNDGGARSEIVGVVPDFPIDPIQQPVDPTIYAVRPDAMEILSIKLREGREASALRALDAAWEKYGKPQPSERFEVEEQRRFLYAGLTAQGQMFGIAAAIAATLACLGMFGLASFVAERRTREVGIRKAMGAEQSDIVRLLMWHLTRPVLLANLIAWPVAYFVMRRWLDGFAYRVDLEPWTFIAASAAALLIAWLTVLAQALRVARAKPVVALRYE